MITVRVGGEDFDTAAELGALEARGGGAVASFVGVVRGEPGCSLRLEHYPGMTDAVLRELAAAARERWQLLGVTIIHRIGALGRGERIVLVATAAAHRSAALESCAFLIDKLKTEAPFWKCETGPDGTSRWIDTRESDDQAAARWDRQP